MRLSSGKRESVTRRGKVIVPTMSGFVLGVFVAVYLGMLLGGLPGLRLDRTGVALLGAIALLAFGCLSPAQARDAIDVPTIALLFGLMVVSAQFRLAGFYTLVARSLGDSALSPKRLLLAVIFVSGLLSAVLVNDIVCLALAPLLVEVCVRRRLAPLPFLLGLACASNVGSAATLIGNPQNILVGQSLQLSFAGYLLDGGVPAVLGLLLTWIILCRTTRGRWQLDAGASGAPVAVGAPFAVDAPPSAARFDSQPFDGWQAAKALAITLAMIVAFLGGWWPREVVALAGAGLLLLSRRMHSRAMLGAVDWPLLVLFAGLFVVNHALAETGEVARALAAAQQQGLDLARPLCLFPVTVVLSNIVSNVPAVMLLLPAAGGAQAGAQAGAILALASTLAGNLVLVGSIANLIVADQAARFGIRLGWKEHARVGLPVTLATLAVAAGWLWLRAG